MNNESICIASCTLSLLSLLSLTFCSSTFFFCLATSSVTHISLSFVINWLENAFSRSLSKSLSVWNAFVSCRIYPLENNSNFVLSTKAGCSISFACHFVVSACWCCFSSCWLRFSVPSSMIQHANWDLLLDH